jgi:hypothetical protein
MKSIFGFSKWTKKMSEIEKLKRSLLTYFLCDDIEFLSSEMNLDILFCD